MVQQDSVVWHTDPYGWLPKIQVARASRARRSCVPIDHRLLKRSIIVRNLPKDEKWWKMMAHLVLDDPLPGVPRCFRACWNIRSPKYSNKALRRTNITSNLTPGINYYLTPSKQDAKPFQKNGPWILQRVYCTPAEPLNYGAFCFFSFSRWNCEIS